MSRAVANPRSRVGRLLDDLTLRLSALFLLAVILMPPEGLAVDLCPSRIITRAPCPGCGMTRSGSNLVRGHFLRAMQYHPFGPLLIPMIAVFGFLGLSPSRWRRRVRAFLVRHHRSLRPMYLIGVSAFMTFGVVRWACVLLGWTSFPATWP
jgi:hypothetical protein